VASNAIDLGGIEDAACHALTFELAVSKETLVAGSQCVVGHEVAMTLFSVGLDYA
jgi:hypothetical protein